MGWNRKRDVKHRDASLVRVRDKTFRETVPRGPPMRFLVDRYLPRLILGSRMSDAPSSFVVGASGPILRPSGSVGAEILSDPL